MQLRKVISTQSAADAYQNDRWRPASGAVGDLQYQAEGGFFSNRYTRFSVIDPEGNRSVIYDVTEEMQKRNLIRVLLILGAAALCLCVRCKNKKGDVRDV